MNTSLKWIKDLVPGLDCTPQEYMDAMTLSGSKVEGYENMDEDLDKIVIGQVKSIEKHPDADKLVICQVQIDEEGNEVKFNVVAFFDIVNPETDEKNEYVIVYEDGYSEDDAFALKVINGEDGEELLEAIDNEVELAAVQEAYNTIFIDEE